MTDYIRRDTLIEDIDEAVKHRGMGEIIGQTLRRYILRQPAADVAPVARCKECEHAERYERTDGTAGYYCGHPKNTFAYGERHDRVFNPIKEADDFCSYGARKENENG